jgi:hypothetical protein
VVCTPYSVVPASDLVDYALNRDIRTDLEVELAQRLAMALVMLEEAGQFHPQPIRHGHDA